jgi:beta-N-acetylhexosaminidase
MTRRRIAALGLILAAALGLWLASGSGPSRAARMGSKHATAARRSVARLRAAQRPTTRRRAARAASRGGVAFLQTLSPDQLAGQRVIYAYAGLRPPASLVSVIRAGEAGGVILFAPNISSRAQIRGVIAQLQGFAVASPLHRRLLILVDQEGGEVRRLPGAPTLSERQIGSASDAVSLARAAGTGAGQNLRGVGANVNLAPVLDVYRRPGNFIDQYARSYSSSSARVASLAAAFVAAQQQAGASATAKHFPGLGAASASQNTDLVPVSLNQSLATLRSADEAPYRAAISAGVRLVMLSWAIYPSLDSRWPAGLSSLVIQRELRGRLRFRGVTITDGINAGAVTPFGSLGHRSVLAAAAGADLILCAATNAGDNTPQQGIAVTHSLADALARHQLSLASARQAVARIMALPR